MKTLLIILTLFVLKCNAQDSLQLQPAFKLVPMLQMDSMILRTLPTQIIKHNEPNYPMEFISITSQ